MLVGYCYSFNRDESLAPTGLRIDCNHDDFTLVPDGDEFKVQVSYARPVEGEIWN